MIILDGLLTAVFVGVWVSDDGLGPTTVDGDLLIAGISNAAAALAALCCWQDFARKERHQGDIIAIIPQHGPAEQIVDGFLPHKAECSGKDHLVVEPGLLAMSPDLTGRVTRRALPDGRHISGGKYSGPHYVAECRAGERTLLFYRKRPALERLVGLLTPYLPVFPTGRDPDRGQTITFPSRDAALGRLLQLVGTQQGGLDGRRVGSCDAGLLG
ncbi:hypothetical protein ACIOMQ_08770 [Streptomyces sp. NPDC087845]|uniref:hypothetical protein n=1 Tax=Streptomyces sp. NPDC087845 TaxID=3365806 RepID=UPI0038180F7A